MAMIILLRTISNNSVERITAMNKGNVGKKHEQIKLFLNPELLANGFDIQTIIEELKLDVKALATSAATRLLSTIIQGEVHQMVGDRYGREGELYPWGSQRGYVVVGGQKVSIQRPRVRKGKKGGSEVIPTSYIQFQQDEDRERNVFAKAMARMSCRDYKKAIEVVEEGYGISKSVISRDLVTATTKELDALLHQSLEDFEMVVLVIDGIVLGGTVFICALGVDAHGKKRVLGFLEGATENSDVCKRMLEHLGERGLKLNRPLLAILDGSKALSKAVRDVCGETVFIQRCQEHKIRNVKSHLPKTFQSTIERKIRVAYKMKHYDHAKKALLSIVRELDHINETAARSLEEGMEETLTVHLLEIPELLRTSMSTTNMIESAYSRSRDVMKNVKRWTTENQKARWLATALRKTEQSFRSVKGYRSMPVLIAALERRMMEEKNRRTAA
jgi:transposase-like protein